MRTYGTIEYQPVDRRWLLETEPHVSMRLKRVFAKISKGSMGTHVLSDTAENARDLVWFLERYPLVHGALEAARLLARSTEHIERQSISEALLAGLMPAPEVDLAVPLREYQKTAVALMLTMHGMLLADDVGLGKAQPDDAHVLTPNGWRRIGELATGDAVVDPDGGRGIVLGVYPQGERDVYRVTTKDGASAECCEQHLWGVYSANDRARCGAIRVLELREFMNALKRAHTAESWKISNWFLPVTQAVDFEAVGARPLEPYLLGVLIGDGTFRSGTVRLACVEEEIAASVRATLPAGMDLVKEAKCDWRMVRQDRSTRGNPLIMALNELGLRGKLSTEKSIPWVYMRAPIGERLALLQGLCDTDGDCSVEGTAIFNTSSPSLRDDVVELVRSLGGIASVGTRDRPSYQHAGERRYGATAYRVNVRLPVCPFRLARKVSRWKPPIMARAIASVEHARRSSTRCIAVSTKRRLYVTDGHLVTHNTASAIGLIADPRARPALVVTLTHLPKQWEAEIHRFAPKLRTHILKKGSPYPLTLGAARGRLGQQSLPGAMPDVIISNYHKLRGWSETLRGIVRTVVFDEVQELRKPDSQKYSSAKHVADGAEYVAGLSATPIYNQGSEMHSVMDVVRPDALGTREEFLREWCRDGANPGQEAIVDPKAFGMHMRELGLMLRRTRSEVGRELPGLTRIPHHVDANLDALDRVSQDCRDLALFIVGKGANPLKAIDDDEDSRGETMRASMELSNKLRQATGIAKAPHVADFVRLLVESGERVVLYGWHRAVYEIWNERLADLKPAMFTGSESTHQKEEAKIRFETGHSKVLILSLRAGAGLDGLQHVCRTVVFGELDWAYGVHEQAEGRVARDGQKDPVMAYYLVSDEGSDPVVSDALNLKGEQLKGIRDPKAELVEQLQTDPYRVRKLAEAYLASRVATIDSMEVA